MVFLNVWKHLTVKGRLDLFEAFEIDCENVSFWSHKRPPTYSSVAKLSKHVYVSNAFSLNDEDVFVDF